MDTPNIYQEEHKNLNKNAAAATFSICFWETWLDDSFLNSQSLHELINYKSIHQVRNYRKGRINLTRPEYK